MKLYNINFKKSYLVNWNKGPWGSLGSKIGVRGCVVWNASRANGMRGMAQRISTTPSRSSWKTQHSTQTQRHCGPTIYAAAVSYIVSCVYSLYIYYILYRKFLCPALYGQSSPNFNGQDKTPGHDGVTANCKLFSILLLLFFSSNIISRLAMLLFAS